MVPLHFVTPGHECPGAADLHQLPGAAAADGARCFALGEAVRAAIGTGRSRLRVAVIGSGSFSLEIGGPKIPPGHRAACTPDPQWSQHVQELLHEVRIH